MAKEFTYKGKTWKELENMSLEEFAKLVPARARRSLLRQGLDKHIMKKVEEAKKSKGKKIIRTHRRDLIIIPQFVGLKFGVYKGNEFQIIEIMKEMLGHYLGEYALTRKRLIHGKAGIGATRSSTAAATRK